jgi:hypothetical protein
MRHANEFECPACKAGPGENCVKGNGQERAYSHLARMDKWEDIKGQPYPNRILLETRIKQASPMTE